MTAEAAAIHSMTGSGSATGPTQLGDLTVEFRSVNGRSLVVKNRLGSECAGLELAIERIVRSRLRRGTVVVTLEVTATAETPDAAVDREQFAAAARMLQDLASQHGVGPATVADVLGVPGVMRTPGARATRTSWEPSAEIVALVEQAIDRLLRSRSEEGRATVQAMREHVAEIERAIAAIQSRAPNVVAEHRDRLIARVNEFLDGRARQLEPDDVIRELGVFADRVDVTEELQRMNEHVQRLLALLGAGGELGRKLEFMLQEMLREVNTLGSKSPDVAIAHLVVGIKSHLDKLREQAANLE